MTPEEFVSKHKKRVLNLLAEDDLEIVEAYLNMEVERRYERKERRWTIKNHGILILGTAALICVIVAVGVLLHNSSAYHQGLAEATEKCETSVSEYEEVQERLDKLIHKANSFCHTANEVDEPKVE